MQANAKLLVLGEHAAVYGAPALGLGLPWPLTLRAEPATAWDARDAGDHEPLLLNLIQSFQKRRELRWGSRLDAHQIKITTEVPLASGFGSSGALCAALARLFFEGAGPDILDEEAWRAEHLFHGTPSGIDTSLALRSGWWALTFPGPDRPPEARPHPTPAGVLVCGAVIRRSDTKTLVGTLSQRRLAEDPVVIKSLETLSDLSRRACLGQDLAPLITGARSALQSLDLESPELTAILDVAVNRTRALAAKLSGAGGGGAWLALYADEESALAALPSLRAAVDPDLTILAPRLVNTPIDC